MNKIFPRPLSPHFRELSTIAGDLTRAYLDFMHVYSWQLHHYQEQRMGYTTLQALDLAAMDIEKAFRRATALAPTPEGAITASVDLKQADDVPTTYTPYLHYTDHFGNTEDEAQNTDTPTTPRRVHHRMC